MVLGLIFTGLKAFTAFWALLVFAVAGALSSKSNSIFGASPDDVNATIAFGVLTFLYLVVDLILIFVLGNHVVTSVMVDTIALGILFILGLGSVGSLSRDANFFSRYSYFDAGKLGSASIGLGWILVFLILGILLGEVILTLTRYGGALDTWLTSFHTLIGEGRPITKSTANQAEMGTVSTAQPTMAAPATAPVASAPAPVTTTA